VSGTGPTHDTENALREHLDQLAAAYEAGPDLYGRTRRRVAVHRRRRAVERLSAVAAGVALVVGAVAVAVALQDPDDEPVDVVDRPVAEAARWRTVAPAPVAPRDHAAAAWTGTELFLWGGPVADGARYDPAADRWRLVPAPPIGDEPTDPSTAWAEWTGHEVVVWGVGAYDPVADRWRALPPSPLDGTTGGAHATGGGELFVWGGIDVEGTATAAGVAYDAATDTWRALPDAPLSPRVDAAAVWSGGRLVVWGGRGEAGDTRLDGATFDPATDRWTPLPAPPIAADGMYQLVAAPPAVVYLWERSGGAFLGLDLHTGEWTSLPTPRRPVLGDVVLVGRDVVLVTPDGRKRGGSRWDPASRRWDSFETAPPTARGAGVVVSTGREVIVWGGRSGAAYGLR
jgi:hypothetical protein